MKVVLSTPGKFHTFDLARQLYQRGMLKTIYTGYPRFKLKQEKLPASLIRSLPVFALAYNLFGRIIKNQFWFRAIAWLLHHVQDMYVCAVVPSCDVFIGHSGTGLLTGRKVQKRGGVYICDRGCSHIRYQDNILREEFGLQGYPYVGIDRRTLKREQEEYAMADIITIPSTFAKRSFLQMGVPEEKLRLVPYGVDLNLFFPVGEPDPQHFDVLFVGAASFQKGIPYLLESFEELAHPGKRLVLAGFVMPEMRAMIAEYSKRLSITCLGHVPQYNLKDVMSRSHVLLLPSVQDGFGLVMAQAMACGCPVIASEHTGAYDLYRDGVEGFIVPIRDSCALAERMQRLADDPALRSQMSQASLDCVRALGGWDHYGNGIAASLQTFMCEKPRETVAAFSQKRLSI